MADTFSRRDRSRIMSRVRSKGNRATELAMIAILRRHSITGWRRHQPLFGSPDFVFPKLRVAIFVDGCFWHSCPRHATMPASNFGFWQRKLARNKARDLLVGRTLRSQGWRVLRLWQHELKASNEKVCVKRILAAIGHSDLL